MDFLKQQNKRVSEISFNAEDILATGKDVIVIGGGDTGSDCVGTSNRQGAKSIKQFEVMMQPPAQRTQHMPWPTYPMVLKTTSSHEEGCDRYWGINTKEFLGDGKWELESTQGNRCKLGTGCNGRPIKFTEVAGSEREIECQRVFLAMGFVHPAA